MWTFAEGPLAHPTLICGISKGHNHGGDLRDDTKTPPTPAKSVPTWQGPHRSPGEPPPSSLQPLLPCFSSPFAPPTPLPMSICLAQSCLGQLQ